MNVIVPCGSAKRERMARAIDLYTGSYFRANRTYALSLVAVEQVFILSAMHGLVRAQKLLEPYDRRMGQAGSVSRNTLVGQALAFGLGEGEGVLVLGGRDYSDRLRDVLPRARYLMEEIRPELAGGGMGFQVQWLVRNRGRLPDERQ